ncbi:MAG: hypothetical protein ACRD29_15625 [Acidimicrobiales bacterium]
MVDDVRQLDEVEAATGFGFTQTEIDGQGATIATVDDELSELVDLEVLDGAAIIDLGENDLAISENRADAENWAVGDEVTVIFPDTGEATLTIASIYEVEAVTGPLTIGPRPPRLTSATPA